MMVVVFRARRTAAGLGEEYQHWFTRMTELARDMPGYISHKGYVADDGERLTLLNGNRLTRYRRGPRIRNTWPSKSLAVRTSIPNTTRKFASWSANQNSVPDANQFGRARQPMHQSW